MKITKKHLINLIKEEISNVRESDAYDAIGADLPDIMAKLPMETVIEVVKDYLELRDLYNIVMGMPEVEMEEIYQALRSQAGE